MKAIAVELVSWQNAQSRIRPIREQVFIAEQRVPAALEWDGFDARCIHALACVRGEAIGTARMTDGGKIGRMAVLKAWRRGGVGGAMLQALIDVARERELSHVVLDAQVHAIPFYRRFGFSVESSLFMDAGIEHKTMRLLFRPRK